MPMRIFFLMAMTFSMLSCKYERLYRASTAEIQEIERPIDTATRQIQFTQADNQRLKATADSLHAVIPVVQANNQRLRIFINSLKRN